MTSNFFALFPGQGSQKVGMGKRLFDESSNVRELFAQADEVLGFSLSKLCFEGPEDKLTDTAIAQPAILTVSVAAYNVWREERNGDLPIVAAGHSLGEYSALVAAGSLSFEDAVLLVHQRGTFMQEAVPAGVGGMVAVLGKEVAELEKVLATVTSGVAEIANLNAPGQIVIAGHKTALEEFTQKAAEQLGKTKVIPLPVSAPFHCSLMEPAALKLAKVLANIEIESPQFPVIANITACSTTEPDEIRSLLVKQVCGRVRWIDCVRTGIDRFHPQSSREFGEGQILSGLMKKIVPDFERTNFPESS